MGQPDMSSYKNLYLQTAKEYIGKISISLDKLAGNPSDKEALNDLHISSHSLRGQSQAMGFMNMSNLSVNLETISNDILNGIATIEDNIINILKKSIEELNLELSRIEKTQ
jgi:chemotaxis protein histidine kinase CheA